MEVVSSVKGFISTWKSGGEANCRNLLATPHCNPSDSSCRDILTTAYNTLLFSSLTTWNSKPTFSSDALVTFLHSVLDNLPSTSSSSTKSTNVSSFGDLFVDIIWSINAELDEVVQDAQATVKEGAEKHSVDVGKANQTIKNAETDKKAISGMVKSLLESGILNPAFCRERLDSSLLEATGLVPDKAILERKEIRMRTALFYKQNKFNLLREQSEGYSKLTIELTSNLGPSHSPATGRSAEPFSATLERARPVWEKVHGIIGYFDLDLNRALDIILDVLSVHLSTHYSFFIALLSFSPWKRPESLGDAPMTTDPISGQYAGKSLDDILQLANPKPTRTDNEGSQVIAQVLGFKFTHYQTSNETPPKTLYLTAALLIREGFMTLEELYPHLSPAESEIENAHNAYLKDVKSRISAAKMSQLAMAAPLESGPPGSKPQPSTTVEQKKPETTDPPNQKAGILVALLSVGALQPAFSIMSKYTWFVDANPEIADLVIRIMKVSIASLYDSTFSKERKTSFTEPRARYGTTGLVKPPPRKPCLTLWAPTPPSTSTTDFVFFFPDWSDHIPICISLDDLMHVVEPIMNFIGLHVSRDPSFLSKFLRLGKTHILSVSPVDPITKRPSEELDDEHPIRMFWYKVLRLYLLPALPLIRGNAVCTVDIWNIIRQYETTARWRLYGEWKTSIYKSHPELRIREVQADRESKGFLRRLSHNTIDSLSGPVAKLAHSNPCIFFSNAVNQIMAYDNLANVVIQALRYVTNMGFDVLVYIILDALSNPNKERVKDDGVNISDWLQSLASFTGMLFRRYSADLTPVLKYIVHQLYAGQTTEIIVLRELIWKMAGIEPLPSLSDSQITAMAGGPALRIEAIASTTRGARLDPSEVSLKGPSRLGRALVDNSLALPLLIQVAQQRQSSIFRANEAPLKSLASLFDSTHGVLLQYLELLTTPSVVTPEDYATKILPPLGDLGALYGVCAPVCMQIIRPVLQTKLLAAALENQEKERLASEETEKRLKAALAAKREPSATQSRVASPAVGSSSNNTDAANEVKPSTSDNAGTSTEDVSMEAVDGGTVVATPSDSPWLPQLSVLFDEVKRILPQHVYDTLGPGFYTTFWQLSTYDLSPPGSKYDEELASLKQLLRQEDSKYNIAERSTDRAKRSTAQLHRARRDRYSSYVQVLAQEYKEQTVSREFTLKRLAREKSHWFSHCYPKGSVSNKRAAVLVDVILEHCITPRCLLSPMDADFCAQFIKVMHTQGTLGFHTLACYDKILSDQLKVILFSCSEYEARNYGRFLSGVLNDLYKWHQEEPTYIQDNRSKVGGKTVQHTGFQGRYLYPMPADNFLKWPQYMRVVRKWYKKLANAFTECIQTGEFMHVYNAIIVLKEILPVFPVATVGAECGPQLDKAMDQFLEKEERGDLKILGKAYSAALKKREQFWAPPVTKVPTKPNGTVPTKPSSTAPEKVRTAAPPVGPSAVNSITDGRRGTPQPSTPSAPRAQLNATRGSQPIPDKPAAAPPNKTSMDNVPRPPVVKRVRTESSRPESPRPPNDIKSTENKPSVPSEPRDESREATTSALKDISSIAPSSLRSSDAKESSDSASMPPPAVPNQSHLAQELRETVRQSLGRSDKPERPGNESRSQNASAVPSPRQRSTSPQTRPGTRNHSSESRASAGRSRSDRANADTVPEDKRSSRNEPRDAPTRRDSLTHTRSDRSARERGDGDRDKDRDRRDRHGDRERDRDRDRDRDREKDRERERDRDRHGDRHRRDDKDRGDRDGRKERENGNRGAQQNSSGTGEDRVPPSRPEPSRHRGTNDDGLGKRRRGDDESERGSSKRNSRREPRGEDRGGRRGPNDKEGHDRRGDSERRRRDREAENDNRSVDKPGEPRPDNQGGPSKALPVTTPSAPRAMSSSEPSRGKNESSGRNHRDHVPGMNPNAIPLENTPGSLRSRIGDKEVSRQGQGSPYPRKDERDSRKRPFTEHDKDATESSGQAAESGPPKRPRILNRNRYSDSPGHGGLARKTLPIDPQASERKGR